jgi:hypothetical protein
VEFNQYKQYLLVTRWVFDFSHYEYSTITLEGKDADNILALFNGTNIEARENWTYEIRKLCKFQNGNPMDSKNCKPVALYRVTGPIKPYENVGLPEREGTVEEDMRSIKFELELIGKFDRDGRPIPNIRAEVPA